MTSHQLHPARARADIAPRGRRGRIATMLVGVLVAVIIGVPMSPGRATSVSGESGGFVEVGQVPLIGTPEVEKADVDHSGWLILDPGTRRGYQIFEGQYTDGNRGFVSRTVIQSFDLDTLQLRRRAVLAGVPITGGPGDANSVSGTVSSGDVVHAVDPVAGRIYLALHQPVPEKFPEGQFNFNLPPDGQRPLARFVAIDEAAFDRCAGEEGCAWAASFREPADQVHLHHYWVLGMTVSRQHVGKKDVGRLFTVFAQPQPGGNANLVPFYTHTLAQWDPTNLTFLPGAEYETDPDPTFKQVGVDVEITGELRAQVVKTAGAARQLDVCRSATMASAVSVGRGNYQWGVLVTPTAAWTACQANEGAGAVARIPLDATNGHIEQGGQESFRLSQRISDVLVDEGGRRLLVRSWGNGHTWWVFDTKSRRFTGSISAKASDFFSMAAGVDSTTGRLYQLQEDYAAVQDSRDVPIRGGFSFSDSRLDPAPPLEIVRPDLAYPAMYRIQVDPVTRRLYVRRGHASIASRVVYPDTQKFIPALPEYFYRVFEDRVPITERPVQQDDSVFTTDTPESDLTRSSYLGAGAGFGVRSLLVGGFHAAANRTPVVGHPESPCGREDREVLSGSVRSVEVSDLSAVADAASLDADSKTQDDLGSPVDRCKPKSSNGAPVEEWPDSAELAFDDSDHEGENLYRADCFANNKETATAPPDKVVSREQFSATATCDYDHSRAEASAQGAFFVPALDAAQDEAKTSGTAGGQVPEDQVRVGFSSSNVSVIRESGKGITVKVDAIARNVVIPGIGTIGAIRGEAITTAGGRPGSAKATYTRTVCGVDFPGFKVVDCLDEKEQDNLEAQMNESVAGRARVLFRDPDPVLYGGSRSGYRAGVQRPADDGFQDTNVSRDVSLALPAMELVLYNGDTAEGIGRQFFHFAGVQAGVSYGISCLYGTNSAGKCADPDNPESNDDGTVIVTTDENGNEVITITEPGSTEYVQGPAAPTKKPKRSIIERIVRFPAEVVADVLRLLFSNPREFALMAAVWALLYLPCYLGERRRNIGTLRARRAAVGGVV